MIATEVILSEAEKEFMYFITGRSGSGMTALFNAILKLDMPNRAKMALGFPEEVKVCNRYGQETGYYKDLCARWKEYTGENVY